MDTGKEGRWIAVRNLWSLVKQLKDINTNGIPFNGSLGQWIKVWQATLFIIELNILHYFIRFFTRPSFLPTVLLSLPLRRPYPLECL